MTDEQKMQIRQIVIRTMRDNGCERDAEALEQETGSSTVAHIATMVAIEVANLFAK